MERIKEEVDAGSRKILTHSERTGYCALFTPAHDGVVVAKIKESIDKHGKKVVRLDNPSYHIDKDSAIEKMCKIAAEKFFIEGSLNSYLQEKEKEYNNLHRNK